MASTHRALDRTIRTLPVALVVTLVLLAGACSSASDGSQADGAAVTVGTTTSAELPAGPPEPGGALAYGIAADTNSLTPHVGQWAGSAWIVANAIYEPLAARGIDGTVGPYLAESITSDARFTEWTIRLRPGISFHDGAALDAEAVVANLDFARQSAAGAALAPIESVTAVDPLTVRVDMGQPWSTFPSSLASTAGYMASPAMYDAADPATAEPVGTGPFALRSRQPGVEVVVERNAGYWQAGLPHLDQIHFAVIPDDTTRANAMRTGDLDAMEITSPLVLAEYLEAADTGEVQVLTNAGQESNELVLALNTATAPFDDVLARQVLAAAIDQEELARTLTGGLWPAAWGPFEPDSPAYRSPDEVGYVPADPARAQELADRYADEHGRPLSFTLQVAANQRNGELAQLVDEQLGRYGVEVEIEQVDQVVSIASVLGGGYQAATFVMFSAPSLDSAYPFIATPPTPSGISLNHTRLDDPAIAEAMDAARTTGDPASQREHHAVVQQRMVENLDRIFLYHQRTADAFSDRVHGFTTATFPGTDERAFSLDIAYPFFTDLWVER